MRPAFFVLKRLLELAGLDKAVSSGLLARSVSLATGPLSAFVAVWTLTEAEQGIYYLILSLIALKSFFELGVGMAVQQIAAHSREDADRAEVAASFAQVVNQWMRWSAVAFSVAIGTGGAFFIGSKGYHSWDILGAWFTFILVNAYAFSAEGRWAMLTGVNRVAEANFLRLRVALVQVLAQWVLLFAGAALFAFPLALALSLLVQEIFLRRRFPWLYAKAPREVEQARQHRAKLRGLFGRAAQTYMTGYFVSQMHQPIAFQLVGPEQSARLGFTMALGSSVIGVAGIWLSSSFPAIATHVSRSELGPARALFRARYKQTVVFTALGLGAALAGVVLLGQIERFSTRLLSLGDSAILFSALLLQMVGLSLAFWPRAFQREPFVAVAYVQMVATPLLLFGLGSVLGLGGFGLGLAASWLIGLAGIIWIALPFWRRPETFLKPA